MLKIKNEYEKETKKLEKIMKEHVTTRNHNAYLNFICKIKCNYKTMFGEDLEKIEKEKTRLKLEIEWYICFNCNYWYSIYYNKY